MKINLKYFGISDFFCIFATENLRYYDTKRRKLLF